ncbi:MAG TPA: hypothetical protein VK843_05800 [Planctomycetota bacterium]|nr:hypothetical protein [Planctomycetota bacterium]
MSVIVVVQESATAGSFAALALGALLERIAASTHSMVELRLQLQSEDPMAALSNAHADLTSTCAELESQGWLFGLFARELGSDVLFERRERRGLEIVLGLVRDILAREGRSLDLPRLPELDSNDERCATICAVIARCVHAAHQAPVAPTWRFIRGEEGTSLVFGGVAAPGLEPALREGAARIPGAKLEFDSRRRLLLLPEPCLVWP